MSYSQSVRHINLGKVLGSLRLENPSGRSAEDFYNQALNFFREINIGPVNGKTILSSSHLYRSCTEIIGAPPGYLADGSPAGSDDGGERVGTVKQHVRVPSDSWSRVPRNE